MIDVSHETSARLERLAALVIAENDRQNLIAASTTADFWERHVVDSLQLLPLAAPTGRWLDLGSGAGFPGLPIAVAGSHQVTLVDSRRLRVAFLQAAIDALDLTNATAVCSRAETLPPARFDVISARAFAPLPRLLAIGARFSGPDTVWLLPKGRTAAAELESVRETWQGDFVLVPSITDADSRIIVARKVRPKGRA